ncbi:iron-containing alcohol dehydrogenase [Escherichia coli]
MTAGLARSLAMKGVAMNRLALPPAEPCITYVCAAVAQLRESKCDGVVAFGGGSVLDAGESGRAVGHQPGADAQRDDGSSAPRPRSAAPLRRPPPPEPARKPPT